DHDWGPAFCLWLPDQELEAHGPRLREVLAGLPPMFEGLPVRVGDMLAGARVGLLGVGAFYRRFTSLERPPATLQEWLAIPEHALAACTNGTVFLDPMGAFSRFRKVLLGYYPEPVRLRKLEARCELAAQSGQYNLPRSLERGDAVAALLAEAEFVRQAAMAAHLLDRRYGPFYKWMHRSLLDLATPGPALHALLERIAGDRNPPAAVRIARVEEACGLLAGELRRQGLTATEDGFLLAHARELRQRVDPVLLGLDPRVQG
ncbi:MAG TPA: DUF4037 domain-containing protein, partial [Holophaga sp.]|nr:DUF4037 domain-containing protein [Holophaga sp.]